MIMCPFFLISVKVHISEILDKIDNFLLCVSIFDPDSVYYLPACYWLALLFFYIAVPSGCNRLSISHRLCLFTGCCIINCVRDDSIVCILTSVLRDSLLFQMLASLTKTLAAFDVQMLHRKSSAGFRRSGRSWYKNLFYSRLSAK